MDPVVARGWDEVEIRNWREGATGFISLALCALFSFFSFESVNFGVGRQAGRRASKVQGVCNKDITAVS